MEGKRRKFGKDLAREGIYEIMNQDKNRAVQGLAGENVADIPPLHALCTKSYCFVLSIQDKPFHFVHTGQTTSFCPSLLPLP